MFDVKSTRTGKVISCHVNDLLRGVLIPNSLTLTIVSTISQKEVIVPSSNIVNGLSEHMVVRPLINHSQYDATSTIEFSSEYIHGNRKQTVLTVVLLTEYIHLHLTLTDPLYNWTI